MISFILQWAPGPTCHPHRGRGGTPAAYLVVGEVAGDGMTTSEPPAVSRTRRAKEVGRRSSEAGSPAKMAVQRRCMAVALPLLAMARPCMKPVGFARLWRSHGLRKRGGREKGGSCRRNRRTPARMAELRRAMPVARVTTSARATVRKARAGAQRSRKRAEQRRRARRRR